MEPAQYAAAHEQAMRRIKEFEYEYKEKFKDFDTGLEAARSISREAIYKIVLLSASIVGFSATVQSIEGLSLNTHPGLLRIAWILFIATIVTGPLVNLIEARTKYVITWRSFQVQEADWKHDLNLWRKAQAVLVLLYSMAILPRSLLLCRIYEDGDTKKLRARQNGMVVTLANLFINLVLLMEVLFIALFIAALVVLVLSVRL
jgi:hypothetical protein